MLCVWFDPVSIVPEQKLTSVNQMFIQRSMDELRKGSVTDLLILLLKRKVKRNASQLAFLPFLHCCTINLICRLLYYSHELCAFLGSPPDNSDEIAHEIWPTSFAVYNAETCNAFIHEFIAASAQQLHLMHQDV